jgi:hypothetical protein
VSERDDGADRTGGAQEPDDGGEPIGPFPTWKALYTAVLIWAAILIGLLYAFTVTLDHSAP